MEKLTLSAELRDINEKISDVRANKKIPAIAYGHKFNSQAISVDYSEFLKLFRKSGHTHIIELAIDGKKHNVLVHEVQKFPVSGDFLHIDFFVVSATEKIHVQIPFVLFGESEAQKQGAMVEQNLHSVDVKCFPKDLVDSFEVDITALAKVGDVIHVQDIAIDTKKFDILSPLDGSIVSAHLPKWATEEEVAEEAVAASEIPTVQDEKKAEKEAEEK